MSDSECKKAATGGSIVSIPIADVTAPASAEGDKLHPLREPAKNVMLYVVVERQDARLTAFSGVRFEGAQAHEEWTGLRIAVSIEASCADLPLKDVLRAAVDHMPSLEDSARFAGLDASDPLPLEIRLFRRARADAGDVARRKVDSVLVGAES
ncbi:MAG: hypothetical protein VB141_11230 [Burkholderia gladioli]